MSNTKIFKPSLLNVSLFNARLLSICSAIGSMALATPVSMVMVTPVLATPVLASEVPAADLAKLQQQLAQLTQVLERQSQLISEQAQRIEQLEKKVQSSDKSEAQSHGKIDGKADGESLALIAKKPMSSISPTQSGISTSTIEEKSEPMFVERQPTGRFPDDAIVTAGEFPHSIKIPDSGGSIRLGGFIKTDVVYDLDSMGYQDLTLPRTIPLDDSSADDEQQLRVLARLSRVNLDYRRQTKLGQFRTFIEADFLGDGSRYTSSYRLRLRHAAAQLGNFYVGQWWSSFDDVAAFPESGDFSGPMAKITLRQPGIRWASDFGEQWRFGVALENPEGDIDGPSVEYASDSVPDTIVYGKHSGQWGHLKLGLLGRRLESSQDNQMVGGLNFSGRLHTPMLGEQDNLTFQVQTGQGFVHYYTGFGGAQLDGIVDQAGKLDATGINAAYLAYQHWWNAQWRSTFAVSFMDLDLAEERADDAFKQGEYYSANVFWTPVDGATLGFDVIYATQETAAGEQGDGLRLLSSFRFDW